MCCSGKVFFERVRTSGIRQYLLFAALLFTALPTFAQIGGSGAIQGVVSDPSGAAVPGVTVVATNVATGVKTNRETT